MPLSSEQVVLVGLPLVVQAKLALVEVVELGGPLVSVTVGATVPPPPPEPPPSTTVPKFCAQYTRPVEETAAPTPIALKFGFSMFARWPDELSQPCITDAAVAYP